MFEEPDRALRSIKGSPFYPKSMELDFDTADRVDVHLTDARGRDVLVEVKTSIRAGDILAWAQAVKYRALRAFYENTRAQDVRAVVVAPSVPKRMAKDMWARHRMHAVSVRVPVGWRPAMRARPALRS